MTTAYHTPAPPPVARVVPPARDPAEVLIVAEIRVVQRKIDALLREEQEFRSAMIDRQVQRMKLEELDRGYQRALRLVQDDARIRTAAGQG